MKKIIYLLIFVTAVFYSLSGYAKSTKETQNCKKPVIDGNQISVQCTFKQSSENFSTILTGILGSPENKYTEDDIDWIQLNKLILLKDGNKVQEIDLQSVDSNIHLYGFQDAVKFIDINFDGHDDIQLWTAPTASANSSYEYWLYNVETKQFEPAKLADKLFGFDIIPDSRTKTISVKSHSGCCYNWERTYHWLDNELRKKTELYFGVMLTDACGQTVTYYNDNEEIIRMEVEPSDYCKGDEHNAPMSLEPFLTYLKNKAKDGNYNIKENGKDKYTVIYNKPTKEKYN